MLKLDNNLLAEIGLGALPEEQKRSMLQHIYDTLELRVGTRLANQMTDAQLQEFEKFIDAGGDNNQAQALQWLETNLPNYRQVVNQVFEELKAEIKQMAPQILATSPVQSQPAQSVPEVSSVQQPVTEPAYGQPQFAGQQGGQPTNNPSGYAQPASQPVSTQPDYSQPIASQQSATNPANNFQPPVVPSTEPQTAFGTQAAQYGQSQPGPSQAQGPLVADPFAMPPQTDPQPPQTT